MSKHFVGFEIKNFTSNEIAINMTNKSVYCHVAFLLDEHDYKCDWVKLTSIFLSYEYH